MKHRSAAWLLAALPLALSPLFAQESEVQASDGSGLAAEADVFHPDRAKPAVPRYGGRVIVHLSSLPKHTNYVTENSAYTHRMLFELHETLLRQDWETTKYIPDLAAEMPVIEDILVIDAAAQDRYPTTEVRLRALVDGKPSQGFETVPAVYGQVTDNGDSYTVTPLSVGNPLQEPVEIPKTEAPRLERGTVFNFRLREGVRWQPGGGHADQFLDTDDVYFSWSIYSNKHVDCDEKRFQFTKVTGCEKIDQYRIRFFYEMQYAFALSTVGDSLTILPSHIYNLADPDNLAYKEHFTPEDQGTFINENQANKMWIGLGPYQVSEWTDQYVEARRFVDADGNSLYFDPTKAGYVDVIRWRVIADDEAAFNAVMNEELDYFERVKSADYFGPRTQDPKFTSKFYKGYRYLGHYGYTGWNLYKPQLKDLAVRKAIAYAFDSQAYLENVYKGLARQVTGPFPYGSPAYDMTVEPFPYDPDAAAEMLDDAGWYDRNGDGTRDKDGVELKIQFLYPSGNDASSTLGLTIREALKPLEIDLDLEPIEWATFLDRLKKREFDSCNLAWVPDLESDPEQVWHSKWGKYEVEGSNHSGVMDPQIDEWIEAGQRELDFEKRQEYWHKIHRRLYYDIQPYLFGFNVPLKFAI
ncbi:MAG TPA: ABC transporter substrate-binding protein, partial [Planctomycetota bacterium]|nr:ABC transporter substrate-binding protein [Planctomycetota bacterium]